MAFFAADITTCLIVVFVFLVVFHLYKKPANIPPGPSSVPILGSIPFITLHTLRYIYHTGCKVVQQYRFLDYLARDYGSVYSIYLGPQLVVVVNDYESVRDAFRNPQLSDRPRLKSINYVPEADAGILFACGTNWLRQRRFTLSTFRNFGIGKSSFQVKIAETEQVIKEFDKCNSNPIDPHTILKVAISNVICSVVFGKRYEYSDSKLQELLENLDDLFEISASGGVKHFIPLLVHFFPGLKEKTIQTNERLRNFVQSIVQEHKEIFDDENMNDYIDVFLNEISSGATKTEAGTVVLTEANLLRTLIQLFIAGSETTVTTLRWCLLYMMAYPDIQGRVQREIDSVVGRSSPPTVGDRLPFTEATIMEVQRIASIVPMGLPHAATADTTLCGYFIPKGTTVLPNLWAIHHNKEIWDEPNKFKPERFLDDTGNVWCRQEYVPFSIGRRACLGENLAKMELFIFFTHLLHTYSFQKPDGSSPITFDSTLGATNAPLPFEVTVTKR